MKVVYAYTNIDGQERLVDKAHDRFYLVDDLEMATPPSEAHGDPGSMKPKPSAQPIPEESVYFR